MDERERAGAFLQDVLTRFKRPKYVRFVDAIPRTPAGKIQKPNLRDAFLREAGPQLHKWRRPAS